MEFALAVGLVCISVLLLAIALGSSSRPGGGL